MVVREYKFHMHDSNARKTSQSYSKIKEAIILKIQKTFDSPRDVASSLATGVKKVYDRPTRKKSTLTDPEEKAVENETFRGKWNIDFQLFREKEEKFNDNWVKAYALIWEGYCSKKMQLAIKEMSTYESQVINEPLKLLSTVESLMHTPERAKYPPLTLVEALSSFLKIKQNNNEELLDYLARFKSE